MGPPLEDMSKSFSSTKPKRTEDKSLKIGSEKPKQKSFGGFSTGFLTAPKNVKKSEKIIKPLSKISPLEIKEVQDNMTEKFAGMLKKEEKKWLNDDLLTKVSNDQKLSRSLDDPKVSQALDWMQKDPKAAFEHYQKNDPEMLNLFKDFMGMLGNHMANLDDSKAKKDKILAKPKIKELVNYLKTCPDRANYMIRDNKDPQFQEDVRFLLSTGDLKL